LGYEFDRENNKCKSVSWGCGDPPFVGEAALLKWQKKCLGEEAFDKEPLKSSNMF
jgi:hypothetical protein